jgi:hypothetical protein
MRNRLFFLALILILQACAGKPDAVPIPSPSKAVLAEPAQNSVCITGTAISNSESSVTFIWNTSPNTDSYDLVLKNLLTATSSTVSTNQTQLAITLLKNTPYSWYVVSKSSKISATAQSETWKFYNSGPGVVTYAPFPAEITAPTYAQVVIATTVNLTWTGSSVETGTIANYDVYFGTTTTPNLLKSAISDNFVDAVPVTSGNTYYWRVITRGNDGNTSDSGLYQFTVN